MDNNQNLEQFLSQISGNFTVAEHGVHPDVMQRFIKISNKLNKYDEANEDIEPLKEKLQNPETPTKVKEKILARLATIRSVAAFRLVEQYYLNCAAEEKSFASLAYSQSRHLIENQLTDNNSGLIITGLGGKGKRLRYFFMIVLESDQNLSNAIHRLINAEVEETLKENDCEVEKIDYFTSHLAVTALVPLEKNLANIIDIITEKCNELIHVFLKNFFVTNGFLPSDIMTNEIIDKLRKNKDNEENQ